MPVTRNILVLFLSACVVVPPSARAQQAHVADQSALDQAVATHAQRSATDRQAIRRTLERQQVRELAARVGIDVKRAEAAVATLDGPELRQIADQARALDDSLAGGQSITLSTTTIIIGLLLLILIIVAVS